MTTRIKTFIHRSTINILRLGLLGSFVAAVPLLATAGDSARGHGPDDQAEPAHLVQLVRNATKGFVDVSNLPAGYGPFLGCVSGPDVPANMNCLGG